MDTIKGAIQKFIDLFPKKGENKPPQPIVEDNRNRQDKLRSDIVILKAQLPLEKDNENLNGGTSFLVFGALISVIVTLVAICLLCVPLMIVGTILFGAFLGGIIFTVVKYGANDKKIGELTNQLSLTKEKVQNIKGMDRVSQVAKILEQLKNQTAERQ